MPLSIALDNVQIVPCHGSVLQEVSSTHIWDGRNCLLLVQLVEGIEILTRAMQGGLSGAGVLILCQPDGVYQSNHLLHLHFKFCMFRRPLLGRYEGRQVVHMLECRVGKRRLGIRRQEIVNRPCWFFRDEIF